MNNYEYYLGGSLPLHATTYVKRQADEDLYQGLKNGEFCYVLNSRQMGKSSLRVKTIQRLQQESIACVSIDMTEIGTHDITPSEWYASIIDTILTGLNLDDDFDIEELWEANSQLSNVRRFSKFIGEILLPSISQNIVIFIDEIDSTISLPFNIDDFFAVVRDCYNKRADNSDYQKLTFAMIGVATPADLIKEKKRTPFNIGRAIKLTGFRLAEVEPLAQGLVDKTANINKLMEVILDWTGGQPFLTQKVCKLIQDSPEIVSDGQEAEWVADLLRQKIIDNWQVHDDPEHLKTIRDRLLFHEKRASRLLGLYQQILIPLASPSPPSPPSSPSSHTQANDNPEQMELRLTGLVVKQEGRLQVANRIYQEVFNLQWVEKELGKLRPYSEAFSAWEESGCKDESRLLRGQALADALAWAVDKSLSDRDYQFLTASQELDKREMQQTLAAERRAAQILTEANQILEVLLKTASSKTLFLAGQEFEALLEALRAAKILQSLSKSIRTKADAEMLVVTALHQAVYGVKECNRLEGHKDGVNSVCFNPSGTLIASGSRDNSLKLWSLSGRELKTFTGNSDRIHSICFHPDGQILASAGSDSTIKLWGIDGTELQSFTTGHTDLVSSVSFSPDGQTLASGSFDQTIKLWSLDGRELQTLVGHKNRVSSISFSPDAQTLASASADKTIKLWSLDGRELKTFIGHTYHVNSISFSPDGQTIASASTDTTIKLWNLDGKEFKTFRGNRDWVNGVSFSPDGQTIASASADKIIKLWNIKGKELQTFQGHSNRIYSVSFSPDGQIIASASRDNTIRLWRLKSRERNIFNGHSDEVSSVSFSPDGQTIASASYDSTVKLWNIQGKKLKTLNGHAGRIYSVSFSPTQKIIASASEDKTIKLWSLDGKELQTFQGHRERVYDVSFSPDGQTLASVSYDSTVKLWSIDSGEIQTFEGHRDVVFNVSFSPDGRIIASVSKDGSIKLWHLDNKEEQTLQEYGNAVIAVTFDPTGKLLATASDDDTIKLWSLEGIKLQTFKGHSRRIYSLCFSPDGQILASASMDRTIKLWNFNGRKLHTFQGYRRGLNSICFSPDGQMIASGSTDGKVILWNLNLESLIKLGCEWIGDYLQNNPNVSESDRHLCDGVGE
ncbi:AAA-like domain-containing protein [Okeania sp. SIO2B3]|uniref:WD40 domain-containing protein n=1 Tax=Okeania sp. SIO2B3 TaxID=2607784 RepID=UPI0013C24ED1|nr:AAA-like domain-containing protein [Okeania sp. SIO2B3]NET41958.1 hypothetical protein [Okeania sp. SIO2B3]